MFKPVLMMLMVAKLENNTDPNKPDLQCNIKIAVGDYEEFNRKMVYSEKTYKEVVGMARANLIAGCDIILYEEKNGRFFPVELNLPRKDIHSLPVTPEKDHSIMLHRNRASFEPDPVIPRIPDLDTCITYEDLPCVTLDDLNLAAEAQDLQPIKTKQKTKDKDLSIDELLQLNLEKANQPDQFYLPPGF